ncbi:MAG: spore coat protein CotJB [Thermoanaerobacteraceae bacterium]|uniref:spore coat protein CotJB n=1 Tax=Thermanaeromonas sp. C210 TaxID=2731925 RepID=UPI00155C36A9|nr:spore coat protein CotJB [Thermanaeromonas sp. C210]MBE3581399.1 spore coat protein CotJB [Thermoanaerobacteraceae bacterium]GFN21988.1 spore coat protein CotJB [Thermanaeromonas sp. C210]
MEHERRQLLKQIMAIEFTALELNLYLDTHPQDYRALKEYNAAAQELAKLKEQYESRYGPLTNYGTTPSPDAWRWIDDPWPWEITF